MHQVMLKPGWPGPFHRSVFGPKGPKGEPGPRLKVLEFSKDVPLKLEDAEFSAVKADLGISLVLVDVSAEGKATVKDHETIVKAHKETAAEKRAADKEEAQEARDAARSTGRK